MLKIFVMLRSSMFRLKPFITYNLVMNTSLLNLFKAWLICGSGYISGTLYVFRALKSPHSMDLPSWNAIPTEVVINTSPSSAAFLSTPSLSSSSKFLSTFDTIHGTSRVLYLSDDCWINFRNVRSELNWMHVNLSQNLVSHSKLFQPFVNQVLPFTYR